MQIVSHVAVYMVYVCVCTLWAYMYNSKSSSLLDILYTQYTVYITYIYIYMNMYVVFVCLNHKDVNAIRIERLRAV
jgi:hypothetical protein